MISCFIFTFYPRETFWSALHSWPGRCLTWIFDILRRVERLIHTHQGLTRIWRVETPNNDLPVFDLLYSKDGVPLAFLENHHKVHQGHHI